MTHAPASLHARIVTLLLLAIGVQCWLIAGHGEYGARAPWLSTLLAAMLALIPITRRWLITAIEAIDAQRSFRAHVLWLIAIAITATLYFIWTAYGQGFNFYPRLHDEFSYLIQTRTILRGRLWMPQHPQADFFETIHVIVRPVYASKYFIGAALLYAPGLGMGLPYWLLPASLAGLSVGLSFHLISRLTRNSYALLAVIMLMANPSLRRASMLYTSSVPILLLLVLSLCALVQWRSQQTARGRVGWAAVLGLLLSFAAITRPLDAVCFAAPIGVLLLWQCHRWKSPRQTLTILAVLALSGVPLLSLQAIANWGITGSLTKTPWSLYTQHDDPFDGMAIAPLQPGLQSQSTLPQKVQFSENFTRPAAEQRREPGRFSRWVDIDLPANMRVVVPHPLMLLLLPLGLLAVRRGESAAMILAMPLVLLAYALYTFSEANYIVVLAPAGALLIVLSIDAISRAFDRYRSIFTCFLTVLLIGFCILRLPQVDRFQVDDRFMPPEPKRYSEALDSLAHKPALVLFHFTPGVDNPQIEPVYNTDVAWSDDAEVIRAHDLGNARNPEIIRYYAQRQPQRAVYRFDRAADAAPVFLGYAKDLAGS